MKSVMYQIMELEKYKTSSKEFELLSDIPHCKKGIIFIQYEHDPYTIVPRHEGRSLQVIPRCLMFNIIDVEDNLKAFFKPI